VVVTLVFALPRHALFLSASSDKILRSPRGGRRGFRKTGGNRLRSRPHAPNHPRGAPPPNRSEPRGNTDPRTEEALIQFRQSWAQSRTATGTIGVKVKGLSTCVPPAGSPLSTARPARHKRRTCSCSPYQPHRPAKFILDPCTAGRPQFDDTEIL
jgi:hypothetical protein